jgi:hypothetical protein
VMVVTNSVHRKEVKVKTFHESTRIVSILNRGAVTGCIVKTGGVSAVPPP